MQIMAVILSQVGGRKQLLISLFFPLDTKGDLETTDGNEVDTANPLCLDHGLIISYS